MGKSKRNCRRTEDEVKIHEKAVKMRKMTELQTSKIPGIGAVTINKLLKVATEHGYIQ